MENFQQTAADLAREYALDAPAMARYADLVSEIGELGKELLLGSNYGKNQMRITDNTAKEIGDVLFALALLADSLDLDMEKCFLDAVEKYKKRFEQTRQIGSEG